MALSATTSNHALPIDWRLSLAIFVAVLVLAIPQAALLPLLDRDEPRFAEASREMLQSGNYVVPTFNGAPRYAKPPLIYWCQAIAYRVFGENAFAARLPSLVATAATALLLVTWGMRLGSAQMGLGAGLLYAFCLQTMQQGRVATADGLLIFFMTLTAFTGWKIIQPRTPGHAPLVCFVVLALGIAGGFLAKGPEALLPIFILFWCARGAVRVVVAGIVVSLLAGLALVLFWGIPAYVETDGAYWKVGLGHDVIDRMGGGDFQGHGASNFGWYLFSVPLYLLLFWLSALPWSPLLVIHRRKLFSDWKWDLTDVYLLLNAALIFLIFSLMVTKLPHYTLPAFPFLALAFARKWKTARFSPGYLTELGWVAGGIIALLTLVLVPVALACHLSPSPVGLLVRDAGGLLTPQTEFAVVDFQEPNTIWEMRRVAQGFGQVIPESEVKSFLNQPGPHAVILSSAAFGRMTGSKSAIPWKVYSARGFNAAKGRSIDLTLLVKP